MGNALFKQVIKLSGLPPQMMKKELTAILKKIGIKPQKLTETTLRKAAAAYLREIIRQVAR
jgi:hypothetical protein